MASKTINPLEEIDSKSIVQVLRVIPMTTNFAFRASPFYFLAVNSTGLVTAGLSALVLWLGKVAIDRVIVSLNTDIEWLYVLMPMFAILACRIAQSGVSASAQFVNFMVSEKVRSKSQFLLLNKASSLDLAFFESPAFFDRLSQAKANMRYIAPVTHSLLSLVSHSFMLAAMFGLLSILHPMTFILLIATVSPRLLVEGYTAKRRFALDVELTRNSRLTGYFESLLFSKKNVKEVRILGLVDYLVGKFYEFREIFVQAYLKLNIYIVKMEFGFDLLSLVGLCIVWIYAVYRAGMGELSIGELFMIFGAAQSSKDAIQSWFAQIGHIFENSLYLTRFFELLDLNPRSVEGALPADYQGNKAVPPTQFRRGIELNNVAFHYPGTDQLVLKDISFSIPANTKLAVVGENGAGKTTLVKLLARFYDPTNGLVLLDGRDYREYGVEELRRNITVIFQDFVHFHISLADNIGLGDVDSLTDRQRIQEAARKGGAHDMAMGLPSQYDTILGRRFSEGVDLSGGEWQNVAISRAFMSEAQLFILDEPTAALDAYKEAEVFDRFSQLTDGRTVLLVSHRFSTVRMADLICVIEDGCVIEYGTHEELVRLNGKYRRMYDAQAERYR